MHNLKIYSICAFKFIQTATIPRLNTLLSAGMMNMLRLACSYFFLSVERGKYPGNYSELRSGDLSTAV